MEGQELEKYVFYVVMGGIVLVLIGGIVPRLSAETIETAKTIAASKLAISYVPGSGGLGSSTGGSDTDAVRVDRPIVLVQGYHYTVHIEPRLRVTGEGNAVVRALVTFKSNGSWAKDLRGDRETFTVTADEDDFPRLIAELDSEEPPMQDFTGPTIHQGHDLIVRDRRTGAPVIVTAQMSLVKKVCRVLFQIECKDDVEYSDYMRGCAPDNRPEDCMQHIELCGGDVEINLLDKPDCNTDTVKASIEYDGSREFELNERVGMSFWVDSECTRQSTDFRQLEVLCPKDKNTNSSYLLGGEFTLKAGLIPG